MLPHVMEFNLGTRAAKYAEVAMAFGVHSPAASTEANARAAIRAVADLSIEVGTAKSITELGATEAHIPLLVQQALTDVCMFTTSRPASGAEVERLYRAAMHDPSLYPGTAAAKL